jgi:hypothetical protein
MTLPKWWGDWRPQLDPHNGDLQPTDLIECTQIVAGQPINTAITGQQIINAAGGGGTPTGYYAQYQDDINQPLVAVNVGQPTKFRIMDFSNGVTVVNDTEITIANTGIYNLQFSFQFQNTASQDHDVTIWLRKNGADVLGSAGFVAVISSHGGVPGHCLPSWNYILDAVGGDYYELYWSATSTQVSMHFYPAGSPPPSAASAIFTVTQQAGIMAGTGMTALNGLSADVQTISTGTAGSDFNVVSSGIDHQFNIPTASALTRGALSSTDWSTFNNKQATLVSGTNIKTVNGNSLVGSGDVSLNPKYLGHSASTGSLSVSTAVTISKALRIPANTLTSDTLLEIQWRMIRVTGNTGQVHTRLYINTSNSMTGATLISGTSSLNGGGVQQAIKCDKTITCRNNGFAWMNSGSSEFTGVALNGYNLNKAVDQYLLFTVQSATNGDTCLVDFFRVLQYA